MEAVMDIQKILKILPHRYPFLMVDRITEMDTGKRIRGYKNISMNENIFNGHFVSRPIFPGVLIIEALAQIGGLLFMKTESNGNIDQSDLIFICGVDKAKFVNFAVPGDKLVLECMFVEEFGKFLKVNALASVDEKVICKAEITYAKTTDK